MRKKQIKKCKKDYSQKTVSDVRSLLWVVTLGGIGLAAMCIIYGFMGPLPWVTAMVGLPWSAHGVVCAFYLNMAKSDHKEGGITFEAAKFKEFKKEQDDSCPI